MLSRDELAKKARDFSRVAAEHRQALAEAERALKLAQEKLKTANTQCVIAEIKCSITYINHVCEVKEHATAVILTEGVAIPLGKCGATQSEFVSAHQAHTLAIKEVNLAKEKLAEARKTLEEQERAFEEAYRIAGLAELDVQLAAADVEEENAAASDAPASADEGAGAGPATGPTDAEGITGAEGAIGAAVDAEAVRAAKVGPQSSSGVNGGNPFSEYNFVIVDLAGRIGLNATESIKVSTREEEELKQRINALRDMLGEDDGVDPLLVRSNYTNSDIEASPLDGSIMCAGILNLPTEAHTGIAS